MTILWTTKDGTTMDIRQMTDSHLRNTIAYMERRISDMRDNESAAWSCLGHVQGEMAQYYVESDIAQISESVSDAEWRLNELRTEQNRRIRSV